MTSYPTDPQPLGIPWTKKMTGWHSEDAKFYEAQSAEDWLGNRFHVGGPVLYCIAAGRGQMVALGKVVAIRYHIPEQVWWRKPTDPDTPPRRHPPHEDRAEWERYVVEGAVVVEVQVRTTVTSGRWNNNKRGRPAWVNEMNVTAVNEATVRLMEKRIADADT